MMPSALRVVVSVTGRGSTGVESTTNLQSDVHFRFPSYDTS